MPIPLRLRPADPPRAASKPKLGPRGHRLKVQGMAHPLALAAIGLGGAGCGAAPLRAPHPSQPLDETRAIELIRESFRAEGMADGPARDLALSSHATLRADVTDADTRLGVAYLTAAERARLGTDLPPRAPAERDAEGGGDELQIVAAASSRGRTRVLVLYDLDYADDEDIGVPRERTSLTSSLKLKRDVLDFLACAKTECWR
jgi:hypothetical protein